MPGWNDVLSNIASTGSAHDVVRRQCIRELHRYTQRNVVVYYSGWLEKQDLMRGGVTGFEVNDSDKNGFMAVVHKLDRNVGLDLILHTPGGDIAATESLVDYLRAMFDGDVRAIIPQLALSAGTMISLSCKEIVMGKHSSLGPIDPQVGGIPAHGIVEEFNRAAAEIAADPTKIPIWQPIIAKYSPALVGECEKAMTWGREMVQKWLVTGMFQPEPSGNLAVESTNVEESTARAKVVLDELADHALTLSHARHISASRALELGLKVSMLEDDQELQERVLTLHHACIQTLAATPAIKIIENQNGIAQIRAVQFGQIPPQIS